MKVQREIFRTPFTEFWPREARVFVLKWKVKGVEYGIEEVKRPIPFYTGNPKLIWAFLQKLCQMRCKHEGWGKPVFSAKVKLLGKYPL
jgi:hypothetical protein